MSVSLRSFLRRRLKVRPRPLLAEQLESRSLLAALAPPGLVSWWRAEGDASDYAGGNNGTLQGTVPFAAGKVGQAFSFAGNAANYVSVPSSASLDLTQFTVDAWIFPQSNSAGFIVDKEAANGINYVLSFTNGSVEIDYQPGNHQFVDAPVGSIPLNTWTHIAGTYDGPASKQLKLY